MKKDLFNIGEKIDIIKHGRNENKIYPSQVLDIIDDKTFEISGPLYKASMIFLHRGEIIDIVYVKENKGRYMFKAKILTREQKNIYKLKIERIGNIRRLQQRNYYRLNVSIPVRKNHLIKIDNEYREIEEKCIIKDISGNGLKLKCNFKHSVGDKIVCNFSIKDINICVESEIVRIDEIENFDFKYAVGLKFLDIDDKQRDEIVKFIFEQERILRDKGLI